MKGIKFGVLVALAGILSACMTYQVDAATYKWTDSDGQVNYTQSAPNNALASTLMAVPTSIRSAETPVLKNKPIQGRAKEASDLAIIEQYNCSEAKNLLSLLEEASDKKVAVLDSQGNKKYLTPDEKADYSEKAKQDMSKYCKS